MAMRFGDYIRELREGKGWTQPEAALKAGIEQSYLSKLETGKSWPSDEVFGRLAEAFGFVAGDVALKVDAGELAKLKEVADVRAAILARQRAERGSARGWLVAMLGCLVVGGGCLGVTLLAEDSAWTVHEYRSMGVLRPDEPLDAYNIINTGSAEIPPPDPEYEAFRLRQQEMIGRLDFVTVTTAEDLGHWYVTDVDGGRRRFELMDKDEGRTPSPLRWFLVPAMALLIGSIGCWLASRQWR